LGTVLISSPVGVKRKERYRGRGRQGGRRRACVNKELTRKRRG
jgi:hypothetical protein